MQIPCNPDFFYIPLIFLESFNAPAAVLEIGPYKIKMPLDWKMLIGEAGQSEMHVLPITSLNDRGFDAFTFNPLSSPKPDFYPIDVVDIYTEVKWYFPKIKSGQMLAVPLTMVQNPYVPTLSRIFQDSANRWTMAQSGRKTITIDAPIMITNNKIAVGWTDENWMHDFFDFIKEN